MHSFLNRFVFSLLFVFVNVNSCFSQKQIKEKSEIAYSITEQDSIIRYKKNTVYDSIGREVFMKKIVLILTKK